MTPPQMPTNLQDLDRATMLLGHMAKGPVKQKSCVRSSDYSASCPTRM